MPSCPPWRGIERCNDLLLHAVARGSSSCRIDSDPLTESQTAAVHMLLLAVPAVAAGFLKAFRLAFLLWPLNLALPLARDLPRACITLRAIVSSYTAGLRGYVAGARRGVQLLQARSQLGQQQQQQQDGGASSSFSSSSSTREDAVALAMLAFDGIY